MRILLCLLISMFVATSTNAQQTGLFKEYDALVTPRADVPIGALWIPGIGPSGNGAEGNIAITKGVSSNTISSNVRKQIGLGLGKLFGLGGGRNTVKSVELADVEIHRVSDIGELKINAGQQFLLEAIKAGRITIVIDEASNATLNANAATQGIPITANLDLGNVRKVTLDGSNLFLAYQVASLGSPKVTISKYNYKGPTVTLANTHRFLFYSEDTTSDQRVTQVRYQNIRAPRADGSFPTSVIKVNESKQGSEFRGIWDFTLPRQLVGSTLTATGITINHRRGQVCFSPQEITNSDGSQMCINGGPEGKIEIRTTTFKMVRVKKPSGTY